MKGQWSLVPRSCRAQRGATTVALSSPCLRVSVLILSGVLRPLRRQEADYFSVTRTSIRLFCWRPRSVSLLATG